MASRLLLFAVALLLAVTTNDGSYGDDTRISPSQVQQGFAASPIPKSQLNLAGKDQAAVGWGSYLVNGAADCSGCHSFPRYLPTGGPGSNPAVGDPYLGTPSTQGVSTQLLANFNVSHYLTGGRCFGPIMARNLTPESSGRPLGLTESEFITALRTGEDIACEKNPADPICAVGPATPVLLQTMPWPTYHSMTDADLKAIYAYLSAIPPAAACNAVADGCPGFSGAAKSSKTYAYPNTADCPNPPPPQ